MEKTFKLLLAGLLLTGFTACEGSDDGEKPGGNGEVKAPYTISVDKSEIEADGKDATHFILTDANGNVLTDNEQLNYIVFENTVTGNKLEAKTTAFTAVKNGTYTFKALYKNKPSENTVTVTAKNRSAYEKYFRKVAAFDITNVNCVYCPLMASALENTVEEWKQHMTVFAIHGPYDQKDPYIIGSVANNLLSKYIGSGSYPSAIFNLDYPMKGAGDAKPEFIAGVIEDQLRDNPATCGIRINSSYAGKTITINAGLTSSAGGKYDIAYAVLLNNGVYIGGTASDNKYNDIVVGLSPNYMAMSADAFTVAANEEHTGTTTFELKEDIADNLANYRVAVFALRNSGNKVIIDNVAECNLGGSVDYKLNE